MPGRPSVRANRAAAAASNKKSGTTSTRSRTTAKNTVATTEIPDEGDVTSLRERICHVFSDAQKGIVTQRKSAINLRKLQELCCYETPNPSKHIFAKDANEYDENDFNNEVGRCLLRVFSVKKSEPTGDRLVKFLGLFLKHASDKDNEIFNGADAANATDAVPETPTSRLTSHILNLALQVAIAKDKVVRYRATQIIAHVINTLDTIDDELFQLVRLALLKRLRDKESNIRVQAVLGLGRLADEGEDQDDEDNSDSDDAGGVLSKLLDVLQNDPSAEVRRALLLNLPFTPNTLPFLLERARDLDAATRRALYSRLLPALGDFRHLSLAHREKLLRWGLRDRDENVRKATAKLFRERWIEDCAASHAPSDENVQDRDPSKATAPNSDALLELLERIDVVNSGVENGVAHEAMNQFWDGRPDYQTYISFEDPYFDQLTAESVFIARTFNEFCKNSGNAKLESLREDKMPEVTKFAFLLQRHIARLIRGVELVALNPDDVDVEEDTVQQEFCVEQLLHIAMTLDYSDEMGRRKMFSIMREALALAELPEECTKLVIEVLRCVSGSNAAGEQEFCSIVLEAVAEVHDTIMGEDHAQDAEAGAEDSFHSAKSDISGDSTPKKKKKQSDMEDRSDFDEDKAVREIMVNMKCLHIAQCMLQNVQCELEKNSQLVTMLNTLVVPAVRSQEAPIREKGLICLGLCCLLSKNLATENLSLFLHCFAKGHEALQIIALQIVSDVLTSHPSLLNETTEAEATETNQLIKPIYKMFSKGLRVPDNQVQTNCCVALSKLMLMGTIQDADLLKQIVLAYFDPDTQNNPSMRQALTYFIPVYCHSRKENAMAMARVAVAIIHTLADRADDLDEEEEMVGINLVIAQICDWTDPRKLVPVLGGSSDNSIKEIDGHVILAEDVLEKILSTGCTKEERKNYMPILSKVVISPTVPNDSLQSLSAQLSEALDSRISNEVSVRNSLNRLNTVVNKLLSLSPESSSKVVEDGQDDPSVQIPDATENDVIDANDLTMLTKPDHEGTVFPDYDDDDDDENENNEQEEENDEDVSVDVVTGLEKRYVRDSLVESLLDEDDDDDL